MDSIAANKTKDLSRKLSAIADKAGLGKKYILILGAHNRELERAGKNLPNAKILAANQLNIFDLLKYDPIILKDALTVIEKTYAQ